MRARPLPTGENRLTPLDQFIIVTGPTQLVCSRFGRYQVVIDPAKEVGHFAHEAGHYHGRFWLAGDTCLGTEHLMPREVQQGLLRLGIEVL